MQIIQKMSKGHSFWHYLLLLCFCIPLLTSCEGQKIIVNDLDEKDANEILVFLSSKQIEAEKVKAEGGGGGGKGPTKWNITVKASESSEAMRLLNIQGLPRRTSESILKLYSTSGLVPSDQQEKIKYEAALAETIASTIRKFEGVQDADVLISFPQEDPLNPGNMKGKITASVWVRHSGVLDDPNSHLKTKIQRQVTSAVTGLQYEDVTVIGERSHLGEEFGGGLAPEHEEKKFVSTWGIILGADSVTRFRTIFFAFSVIILLLTLALVWVLWKVLPLLKKSGGLKGLLSLSPIGSNSALGEKKPTPPSAAPKAAKKEEKKAENSDESSGRNIDET